MVKSKFTRKTLATAQPKRLREMKNLRRSITRQQKESKKNSDRIKVLEMKRKGML